ncbi:hypothetical protein BST12_15565 [Mycobacterium angelicum]|uniref:Uncharacterized protein n=1 Tax=Mycobacterium angelicum TaxID=470074 RepID=A0A1W9ZRP3_MYCAN|nr:hypothetical protein BST12_15565 [Mycobacterium angelicum]
MPYPLGGYQSRTSLSRLHRRATPGGFLLLGEGCRSSAFWRWQPESLTLAGIPAALSQVAAGTVAVADGLDAASKCLD